MIINLSEQAQQLIGKNELVVITERVDDVALLLARASTQGGTSRHRSHTLKS